MGAQPSLRAVRTAAGLSQARLAELSGVSRQAIGAIEAGRHRPSVDAALAIARAVGRSVEELFARPAEPGVAVLGPDAGDGTPVRAARVGDRVVHVAAHDLAQLESWPLADAVMDRGRPRALPGADLDGFVVVGCDPALGLAAELLSRSGPGHVVAVAGSTAAAVEALGAGRAHAALVHGPVAQLPRAPVDVVRLHVARWRVGLASRGRGRGAAGVADVCRPGARVVQREPGASSQQAFRRAVLREGAELPGGPLAAGHLDVARRVVAGARAGVTMEPAALAYRLRFAPLEEHAVELWIDARWREHPAAERLHDVLGSPAFRARVGLVGGYDLAGSGSRVTPEHQRKDRG
jgi:DNA-binding XRE family transcriptional regulator/molybdate-binding protein